MKHFPVCSHHWFLQCLNVFIPSRYLTEFVTNLAAISHIKKLISFRPQIIGTLIFILASIRVNMWLGAVMQPLLSFFPLSFCPSEILHIPLMFLLCSNSKQSFWLDLQSHPLKNQFDQKFCTENRADGELSAISSRKRCFKHIHSNVLFPLFFVFIYQHQSIYLAIKKS